MQVLFLKKTAEFSLTNPVQHGIIITAPENRLGEMSERFKEPVLKTGDVKASVGSNPTLSATFSLTEWNTGIRSSTYAEVPKWPKGLPC